MSRNFFSFRIGNPFNVLEKISITLRRSRYETLRDLSLTKSPKALAGYGYKVFSQGDEDGIIAEIFKRIGVKNKIFVEFGVGDGLENNTLSLLHQGWTGLWIEGSAECCKKIFEGFSGLIKSGKLKLVQSFIFAETINGLISSQIFEQEIDLLSIDIDGNDAHIYDQISCVTPRVIVLEYNAKFGPVIEYCMPYNRNYRWSKTDCFGASLKYFEKLMSNKGYTLVGCNLVGTNAFFVRTDLVHDHFDEPFSSEYHFEPARYELAGLPSGHLTSYETHQSILS